MPEAYWIAKCTMRDMKAIEPYLEQCKQLVEAHPHVTLARHTRYAELEGSPHYEHYYLHRFPSYEAALAMYNSPEYQAVAPIRRAACDGCELVILEAGDLVNQK
jgi:uncharacterized protein (DUF1330 family)